MAQVKGATEPDYVEILLRAARRQREENAAAVPAKDVVRLPPEPTVRRRDALPAPPTDPGYVIHWLEMPTPVVTGDQARQPQEPVNTGPFCTGASWGGEPEEYQAQAGLVAVAAGVTIVPWNWVETSCGNAMCLEVKHMVFRKPERLLYPAGICVYCGDYAGTRDHLLPVTHTGKAVRRHVRTVPACRQCNSFIGDAYAPSITERRSIAQSSLRRKHFRLLRSFDYTDDEMDDFGHAMKSSILRAREVKEKVLRRLAFPGDDSYDIEYLALSGIEDPYAFGLLKTGEKSRGRRR
jgi:hypothetical protein